MNTVTTTPSTDRTTDPGAGTPTPDGSGGSRNLLIAAGLAVAGAVAAVAALTVADDTAEPATDEPVAAVVASTEPAPDAESTTGDTADEPVVVPAEVDFLPDSTEQTDEPEIDPEPIDFGDGAASLPVDVTSDDLDDIVDELLADDVTPLDLGNGDQTPVAPAPEVVVGQDDNGDDIVVVFEISQICATTHHQQFGDQPSSIRWVFDAPGLADGTNVVVPFTADGSVRRTTTVENSRVVAEQGIDSYGSYPFPPIEWTDADGNENRIDPDGQHVVDDREGEASTTCLS